MVQPVLQVSRVADLLDTPLCDGKLLGRDNGSGIGNCILLIYCADAVELALTVYRKLVYHPDPYSRTTRQYPLLSSMPSLVILRHRLRDRKTPTERPPLKSGVSKP